MSKEIRVKSQGDKNSQDNFGNKTKKRSAYRSAYRRLRQGVKVKLKKGDYEGAENLAVESAGYYD